MTAGEERQEQPEAASHVTDAKPKPATVRIAARGTDRQGEPTVMLSEPIEVGGIATALLPEKDMDGILRSAGYTPTEDGAWVREEAEQAADVTERTEEEVEQQAEEEIQPVGNDPQWGNVYQWATGKVKEAVDFLRKHRSGYLKGVFHRDEIGDIDLAWGNDKAGLQHIIQRHIAEQDDFNSVDEAVEAIKRTVQNGKISQYGDRYIIDDTQYRVIVAKDTNGNWVITAYDNSREKESKQRNHSSATPLVLPSTGRASSSDVGLSHQESGGMVPESEGKGNENNPNAQEVGQKNVPFAANLAAAPRDEQGRVDYTKIENSDELARVVTAQMRGDKDVAKRFVEAKKKAAKDALKNTKHRTEDLNDPDKFLAVEEKMASLQKEVSRWDNALTALRTIRTEEEQAAYDAEQARQQAEREARKQTEAGAVGKTMAERYAAAPKIDGNAGTITTANGQVLKGHYVLVSADGLTPSHDARNGFAMSDGYPTVDGQSINDCDYKNDPEEQAKVLQIAQQYNGNAIKNMPIVSDEGLVYNGNGRTMAGQLAAQQGTDGAYTQALADNAAQFGFTAEQAASVPNARVVFQTDERLPYNTTTLAMFNATEQQAQSNTAKAAANTRKLAPEAIGHIIRAVSGFDNTDAFFNDKKAPFDLIDRLIEDKVLTDRDKAALIDGNRLSGAGKDKYSPKELYLLRERFEEQQEQMHRIREQIRQLIGGIDGEHYQQADKEKRTEADRLKAEYDKIAQSMSHNDLIALSLHLWDSMQHVQKQINLTETTSDGVPETLYKELNYLSDEHTTVGKMLRKFYGDENIYPIATSEDGGVRLRVGGTEQSAMTEDQQAAYDVVRGMLEDAGVPMEMLTDEAMTRLAETAGVRTDAHAESIEEADKRFNEELDAFGKGSMRSSDMFDLGKPSPILLACGLKQSGITMTQSVLKDHMKKHGLTTDDVRNLPFAISNPILVYEWGTKAKSIVIITDISRGNDKITVAVKLSRNGEQLEINSISSVHGKSIERLTSEMSTGKSDFGKENLRWVNKKRVLDWFAMVSPLETSQDNQELISAAKVVKKFENPKFSEGKNEKDAEKHGAQILKDRTGVVYGAAVGGKIYLNGSRLNPNTPMHEYTHLWDDMVRRENPSLWERGKELLKQLPLWDEVKNDPNYANIRDNEDEVASEVHSRLSGEDGAKLLDEMVERAKREGTKSDVAKSVSLKNRIKDWLQEMWADIKGTFEKWSNKDLSDLSVEQFSRMPLRDLAEGISPKNGSKKQTAAKNAAQRYAAQYAEPFDMTQSGKVRQTVLAEIRREREEIERKAKADGTWMKAPNGNPTNLTQEQWITVRTKRFKNWFGDWNAKHEAYIEMPNRLAQWLSKENIEKAKGKSRDEILKEFGNKPQPIAFIPVKFLQYVDKNLTDNRVYSGMGYFIDHAVNHHPNIPAEKYQHIQDVLNNPDEVKAIVDNGNNSIVFIKQIDRYNAVVIEVEKTDDGRIIWHKSFYDQKKKPYANKGTRLYESSSEGGVSPIIRTDESAHDSSLSVLDDGAKVQQKKETTKSFGNFLRPDADFSQIVDENGEPMVVYHGTRADFSIFDRKKNNPTLDGFYFTDREELAKKFAGPKGRVGSYFLNVRNTERNGFDGSGANMKKSEYRDGGIFIKRQTDRYAEKGTKEIIVFSPNQIKSATDNAGTFSTENDDIRFSIIGEKGASGIDKSEEVSTRIDNLRVARQMEHEGKDERAIRISDNLTEAQQLALDAVMAALANAGVEVDVVSEETARAEIEKGESLDTEIVELMRSPLKVSAVSSDFAAKVQKNLETTKEKYKKVRNETKNIISDIAKAFDIDKPDSGNSRYITFQSKNGTTITLRLSNHNAHISNFDNNEEKNGISIVISRKPNSKIINDGNAHVVEFFYSDKAPNKAEGTPIADIIGALEQMMYSGEYKDPTGVAQVQEVNMSGFAQNDGRAEFSIQPDETLGEYAHRVAQSHQQKKLEAAFKNKAWAVVLAPNDMQAAQQKADAIADYLTFTFGDEYPLQVLPTTDHFAEQLQTLGIEEERAKKIEHTVVKNDARGFMEDGTIFVVGNKITNLSSAKDVYIHERQHVDNEEYDLPEQLMQDISAEAAAEMLRQLKPNAYKAYSEMYLNKGSMGHRMLLDELIAYAVSESIQFAPNDPVQYLQKRGITNQQLLNIVENESRRHRLGQSNPGTTSQDRRVRAQGERRGKHDRTGRGGRDGGRKASQDIPSNLKGRNSNSDYVSLNISDAPTPDADETRSDYVARFKMWYDQQRSLEAEQEYHKALKDARNKTEYAVQHVADRYRPLQKFQEFILSKGGTIRPSEQDADGNLIRTSADAYQDTTLATGRAGYQVQRFKSHQLQDMADAIAAILDSKKLDGMAIRWNNIDTDFTDEKKRKNGTRLTARELIGVYTQAKDCQEAIEHNNIVSGLNALRELAGGSKVVHHAMQRNDLKKYGADTNISFYFGETGDSTRNYKGGYGIAHIGAKHGGDAVLRAIKIIANGKIDRYVEGNKTIVLTDGEYEVLLALTRFGEKETWLFNGWKKIENTDGNSEVSTQSDPTQANPTFSREDLGAVLSSAKLQKDFGITKSEGEKKQNNIIPDRGTAGFLRNLQDAEGEPVSHEQVVSMVEDAVPADMLDRLWETIRAATQFSLDYQLAGGMIDQATHARYTRQYYVPERGWRERDLEGREDQYVEGKGTHLNGNPYNAALRKANGRESIASDPFAYIQSIAETTILTTERNKVKQKFLQMLLDNQAIGMQTGAWEIRRAYVVRTTDSNGQAHEVVTYEKPEDEKTIVTTVVPESMIAQRTRDERLQHRVAVMRDGQQYIIELQDEALANALNSNFQEAKWLSNSFANVARKGVRYMSAINTQYNPAFAIWNLARDLQIGVINNIAKESPAFNARFVKNIAAVQPVIMQYVWNDHMHETEQFGSNPELSRYLQEYFESGAQTGFSYMQDIETLGKAFDKMLEGEGAAKRLAKGTAEFLSMATELSELTVRFAEFATARQMGFTTEEAAAKAKEVSVNFDRKGLLGGTFSSLYSFFNATVQGSWNILRGLKSKRAWIAYTSIAAFYTALGVINTLLNPDDPDDDVFFSDYDRQTNFLIGKIKLPVTHIFRMFFAMGVNTTLWLQGKKTGMEMIYDNATFVLDEMVPASFMQVHNFIDYNPYTNEIEFAPEKYAQAVVPSVISPITDVALNRDFKGATIHSEPFMLSDGTTYKRVAMEKRNTPEIYHDITEGLHRLSGGNPDVKTQGGSTDGRIDLNPNDLQHIVEGYLGGLGSFTGDIISTAVNAVQGEFDPMTVPVVNRAFRPYQQERAYAQQYYLLKNRVEHYEKLLKDQAENDREAYRDETRSELYRVNADAQRYIKHLPKPTDDGRQSKEQVKELMKLNVQWNKAQ